MKPGFLIFLFGLFFASTSWALTPEAEAGKAMIAACTVCHEETLDPPKGPPLFALNKRYSRKYPDKAEFVEAMRKFVVKPQAGNSLLPHAVDALGLMPAMPLPDDMLNKIAAYIYEENFPYPCEHWRIGVKMNKERGDLDHAAQDQRKLDRFCQ